MRKTRILKRFHPGRFLPGRGAERGFSLIELLIGSAIMLLALVGSLSIYSWSNQTAVDQQQYADLQNDVRSGMYFIAKDVRSAGVGFSPEVAGYFLEGTDAESPGPAGADSIRLMGNFDDPLNLLIHDYNGGQAEGAGGSANVKLFPDAFLNTSYPCPGFYENRIYFIISVACPGCYAFRYLGPNMAQCGNGQELFVFTHGSSPALNPPGGLVDPGCGVACWQNAIITLGQIKFYWLDTTGAMTTIHGINLTRGQDGYLGQASVLYISTVLDDGAITHLPLAHNIENLQFQYNGDLDVPFDGLLDGWRNWDNANWTILATHTDAERTARMDIISRISQVRMWVQGRTERPFVAVRGTPPGGIHLYQRPTLANSPGDNTVDRHRRFVLESTSNIRNLSLNLYNLGTR